MANIKMPADEWVCKGLQEHGADLLKEMVGLFAQVLMSADVDAICGASYENRSPGSCEPPQRVPTAALRHAGGHDSSYRSRR